MIPISTPTQIITVGFSPSTYSIALNRREYSDPTQKIARSSIQLATGDTSTRFFRQLEELRNAHIFSEEQEFRIEEFLNIQQINHITKETWEDTAISLSCLVIRAIEPAMLNPISFKNQDKLLDFLELTKELLGEILPEEELPIDRFIESCNLYADEEAIAKAEIESETRLYLDTICLSANKAVDELSERFEKMKLRINEMVEKQQSIRVSISESTEELMKTTDEIAHRSLENAKRIEQLAEERRGENDLCKGILDQARNVLSGI